MDKAKKKKVALKGIAASPGKVMGKVRLVKAAAKVGKFNADEIIVAAYLDPDFLTLVKKYHPNAAIITDRGGATSHIAVLAREFNIPYVAGTALATKMLKEGMTIILDGHDGTVYEI